MGREGGTERYKIHNRYKREQAEQGRGDTMIIAPPIPLSRAHTAGIYQLSPVLGYYTKRIIPVLNSVSLQVLFLTLVVEPSYQRKLQSLFKLHLWKGKKNSMRGLIA